jgi:hypothetical protein
MKFSHQFSLAATGEAAIAGLCAATELLEIEAVVFLLIGVPLTLFLLFFAAGLLRRP